MEKNAHDSSDRIAYSIPEFGDFAGGLSRTTIYRLIRDGELSAKKVGRRRIIPRDAALDWIGRKKRSQTSP